MAAKLPETFGEYELLERLGVGGMAETFEAVRRGRSGFEQRVCVKRILPSFSSDPTFVSMFLREARLSAVLHHEHIARLLDFGQVDETFYLVLELVDGTDLRGLLRHLRRRALPLSAALTSHLAHALGDALAFAHSADDTGRATGVIHRDVSPSNVLLSHAGEVKLADFGIAKASGRPATAPSGALKGKLAYMAPEYALGAPCSPRSDLFSLGVVLYECLAGFRPYDGGNDMQTLDRARMGQRPPLADVAPGAPRALTRAVESLIEPKPSSRPPTVGAFLAMIEDAAPPALAPRELGKLVQATESEELPSMPGLAATRPVATRRPRKHLPKVR